MGRVDGRAAVSPSINHPDMVFSGVFSPDDKIVVTYGADDIVRAWDWRTAKRLPWSKEYGAWLGNVLFSPDGNTVIRYSSDGLQLWDTVADKPISPIMPGDIGKFSPNGLLLLTVSDARGYGRVPARVWDAKTGKAVTSVLSRRYLAPASFSPDGGSVLSVDEGSVVILPLQPTKWSLSDCEKLAELLSASRLDDGGAVIPIAGDEWRKRWGDVQAKMPEFFQADAIASKTEMLPSYKRAIEAQVSAAKSDAEKKELAWRLSAASVVERVSGRIEEALLLAETAVKLDETNLDAKDNLATAYLKAHRYEQALAIYNRYRGTHYDASWYASDMKNVVFGDNARSVLKELEAANRSGTAEPTIAKIREALRVTSTGRSDDVWDRLISASESAETYRDIHTLMQEAIKQKSVDRHNLNALGYAQYRLGEYAAAISTLNQPDAINPDRSVA